MSLQRRQPRTAAPCSVLLAVELLLIALSGCSAGSQTWPHAESAALASRMAPHAPAAAKQQQSSSNVKVLPRSAVQQLQALSGRCDEWWLAWLRPACRQQMWQQEGVRAVSAAAGKQQQQQQRPARALLLQRRALGEAPPIPHIIHQVFLDGQAALEEEERREERAGREFRRFNHRCIGVRPPQLHAGSSCTACSR